MGEQLTLPLVPARAGTRRTSTAVLTTPDRPAPSTPRSRRRVLEQRLAELCNEPVQVVMTDNRSVMLTGRRRDARLVIRLHHMFLDADERVLKAVARFADQPDRWSRSVVDGYIQGHSHLISAEPGDAGRFTAQGQHHDLQALFDDLNRRYFETQVKAEIGWGDAGNPRRRRRRSIQLGSYDDAARRITMHPALDQKKVPAVYVAYVVFHEMLHQIYPPRREGQRTRYHGPEFRHAERAFADRREALLWYRQHEDVILRYRRDVSTRTAPTRPRRGEP